MALIQPTYKNLGQNILVALSYWRCLMLTILIDACVISVCWCQWTSSNRRKDSFQLPMCHYDYLYIPSAFMILFYFIYLIECWKSQLRLEISYPIDIQSAYTYFSQLKALNPDLYWQVSCFHYSRSLNSHNRYQNVNHIIQPKNSNMYEKVVTETSCGRCNMHNLGFYDKSPNVQNLENHLLVKLQIKKKALFQTESVEEFYNKEKKQFLQPFQFKDDFLEVNEGLEQFNKSSCSTILVTNHHERQPLLISNKLYIICALLLLSWPLRLLILCKTAHLNFDCVKIIGARIRSNDTESLYSIENLEKFPPSYSEALKLCESNDAQNSLIFCNQSMIQYNNNANSNGNNNGNNNSNNNNVNSNKYESSSSKDSLYSLEYDLKFQQERNGNSPRANSISDCFNNMISSARKMAGMYLCNKPISEKFKTISLNIISSKNANIKRDISLPINFQAAEM